MEKSEEGGGSGVMDTFYISHGSPTLSIDDSLPARKFLQSFRETVCSQKPTAILVVSGHWETSDPTVNAVSGASDTIYDFYGFPKEMYKGGVRGLDEAHDCGWSKGSPELANRVQELLLGSGFPKVNVDKRRGLDHGAWVPLMLMYPEADIPVSQLSILPHMDATYHYNLGKALAPLKYEGVLIIGSGSATHNLRTMRFGADESSVASWAKEFDSWLEDSLVSGRFEDVNHYEEKAPHAKRAHPSPDHFYPLHVAMGAAGEYAKCELIHRSWSLHTISYASYKFTTAMK